MIEAAGATLAQVVRVTVYLRDVGNSPKFTNLYAATFTEPFPARTTIESKLPLGAEIEIDAIVALDG